MIYRAVLIAVVVIVSGIAWVSLPVAAPVDDEVPPTLGTVQSGVLYCVGSGVEAATAFQALAGTAATSLISLLDSNVIVDTAEFSQENAATASFTPAGQLFGGGAVIEVSSPQAGAAWISEGPTRATATTCYPEARRTWSLYGGAIGAQDRLVLRLMNPLLSSAKADIRVSTEFGPEPITDLEAIGVAPRDVIEIPLHEVLGQRVMVKVEVEVNEGRLLPAIVSTTPNGIATWPAGHAAPEWYLPTVRVGGVVGDIVVTNPRREQVEVEFTGIDSSGVSGEVTELLEPNGHTVLPSSALGAVVLAARISSSSPVIVSLVGDSESGRFGDVAVAEPVERWMVAGPARAGAVDVWIFNPSGTEAQVSVGEGAARRSVRVSPGTAAHVTTEAPDGVLVVSDVPIAVSWSTQGRLSLSGAWPFGEE